MSFVMADFYKRFVDEELDSEGRLKSFKLDLPENFNFSYDVIDELAKNVPDKVAMQWVNEEGEEHIFTYKDLSEKSSQVANMMLAHGVKKGDFVMAVLKRVLVPCLWSYEDRRYPCACNLSAQEKRLCLPL